MANWETLQHVVEYARQKNALANKALSFALVTNLSLMTEDKLDYLLDRKVQICTSLDGPADLHDKIRIFKDGGSAHERVMHWMKRINQRYAETGLDGNLYRVEALPTITRPSLGRWKDIVDQYVEVGCRAIFLRKLDPFGFAARSVKTLGYSMDEFLEFYAHAVDYIIELNRQGTQVMERHAAIMLGKILGDDEPNYLDLRTPGGAVIGQLGYAPDGAVYSSDEGRFVAAMNDELFRLGTVEDSYRALMTAASTRAACGLAMRHERVGLRMASSVRAGNNGSPGREKRSRPSTSMIGAEGSPPGLWPLRMTRPRTRNSLAF